MRTDEVEPYVRQIYRERFSLTIRQNEDLRDTNPQLYAELCREGMARAEESLQHHPVLEEMCRTAFLSLPRIISEERQKVQMT